jgi:hypothetical protein
MNIFYAILEVVRTAIIWAMGLILDRELQDNEAYRMLFLIVATGVATWLTFYWRSLALRWRFVRKRLLPEERYAGRYLQAVHRDGGEIRYVIVHICYNSRKKRFEAYGRAYNDSGEEVSSFQSHHLHFPAEGDENLEFIWQGRRAASGYTCMKVEARDGDYIEGSGYVIAFGQKPKTYPLLFKRLHGGDIYEALGVNAPAHPKEEAEFIKKFHGELGAKVRHSFESTAEEVA